MLLVEPDSLLQVLAAITTFAALLLLTRKEPKMSPSEFANFRYKSTSATNLLSQEHSESIARRDWNKVMAWIAFHSDEVSRVEDPNGHTALHQATLFKAPVQVIALMLWAAPELASVANRDGELPIHWAIRLSSSQQVISLLLQASPTSAFKTDRHGTTPLSLIWDRSQDELLKTWKLEKPRFLDGSNRCWNSILAMYRHLQPPDCDDQFLPLHLAAAHASPPSLFPLMLQVYEKDIVKVDRNGRFPLSIACECSHANVTSDVFSKVDMTLQIAPHTSGIVDGHNGRYPLHIALASGVQWEEGVMNLIKVHPEALTISDSVTGLPPFALATTAVKRDYAEEKHTEGTIDTVYSVLRSDPSVLRLLGF